MSALRKFTPTWLGQTILILAIAAVTYLPNLSRATIYRDDWYYTMDRLIGGPGTFQAMFSIDRPARGPLFEAYYQLFGIHPFLYHMSSFLWRFLGGVAALWLFYQLFPRQRLAVFMMAFLFVLYPGYVRWMEGFEDQPRILSSFLEVLSIALTLQAIRTTQTLPKVVLWICSILTGWMYLALVDFSFGMEVFRLLCVFLLIGRDPHISSFSRRIVATIRAWGIAFLIPFGFLFWRLFFFHNERPATDVGLQISYLLASPLLTGFWWLVRLFQSTVNVIVLAWGAPLFQNLFDNNLSEILIGLLFATVAASLWIWSSVSVERSEESLRQSAREVDQGWQSQAITIGLIGVVVGILPVIVANRYVSFGSYSHYALPASLASVLVIVGTVFLIKSRSARLGVGAGLIALAVLTHYTASLRIIHEEQTIASFWQQVVWRAPQIKAGTTLVVNYPSISYAEDVDAVAGPANFIYFPQETGQIPATYPLIALPQMDYISKDVIGGVNKSYGYRTHVGEINYDELLVMSQPLANGCVHIMDARWPRYSDLDSNQILLLGQYSKIQNVSITGSRPQLPASIFGAEPAHGWCYYYQQAELALQEENWQEIIQLGDQVTRLKLSPNDRIEWSPFLQAYAMTGAEKEFKATATKIDSSPFVRREACKALLQMQTLGYSFRPEIQSVMNEKLCRGQDKASP